MDGQATNEPRKLRVLQVVGGLGRGGTETWLRNVQKPLDPQRFQFDYLVHPSPPGAYDAEIQALGGRLHVCEGAGNLWVYRKNLQKIIREHGPYDVLHTHLNLFNGIVLPVAAKAGVRVRVCHSHASLAQQDTQGLRWFYTMWMLHNISANATHGLAVSPVAAEGLFGKLWESDTRIRLLYCGIDLEPFLTPQAHANELRASLGIPEQSCVVGHIGRFNQQKNHDFLIRSFAEVVKRRPDSYLLLIGEGELRSRSEELAKQLGIFQNIRCTGGRADVPDLLVAMSVFAFPSFFEGLGLVAVEAQAAGLHVIVTDNDAVPKEVAACPELVTFVPLTSPTAWADALLAAPVRSVAVAQQALKTLQGSRYDVQFSARELCRFYTEVCVSSQLTTV